MGLLTTGRADKVLSDLNDSPMAAVTAASTILGDLTDNAILIEDNAAKAWMAQLPSTCYPAIGNHDTWTQRTPTEAAAALGLPAKDYAVDLPFGKLLVIGPDTVTDFVKMTYGSTCLDWLDAQLTLAGSTPVFIACHAPMYNTVGVSGGVGVAGQFHSLMDNFYCHVDADVRAVLADHSNVKAWISGHTHSPITAPGLVKREVIGGTTIAHINASALPYVGQDPAQQHKCPLYTLYVSYIDDVTIQVRFRNHGAGMWDGPNGVKVLTVDLS